MIISQSVQSLSLELFCNSKIGDTLQVSEFMCTFGDKLKESLKLEVGNSDVNSAAMLNDAENGLENNDHAAILSNIELFRMGLQNKKEKYRKEVQSLVQLLLKAVINNGSKGVTEEEAGESGENVNDSAL